MNGIDLNLREIFSRALEISEPGERREYLEQACEGNAEVRQKVENLLAAHFAAGDFLNGQEAGKTVMMEGLVEPPGTQIGPYKLREQIGEGGFGVVYVAEQTEPVKRRVALKIIKPGMDTKDVIARFEAERQALAVMDHPNVARVLDAGATESGRPYFVMELVHGVPITEFCDEQKLSNDKRLKLFVEVCRAVQHAHQKGIIHRDLKPSNIMVTMHDDKPVPKVIDFGIAKALCGKLTEKTVYTSYGQMVGTPLYMSPEQAQMSGLDVDTRSDVYSLGVLLYVLLTGTTPFDPDSLKNVGYDELRRMIREDDPPRPSARISTLNKQQLSTAADCRKVDLRKLGQSLCGELDWIVMKALEKDRTRRYESASSLAEDVENYLSDEPVEACPPSLGYRFRKFARRNRTILTTSSFVALALVIGTIVSTFLAARAIAAEETLDQERKAAVDTAKRAQKNEKDANRERDAAVIAREKLRRVLYASEINRVQSAWDSNNYRRVMQILESARPKPGESDLRGFEWHYWNRQLRGPLERQIVDVPKVGTRRLLEDTLSPDGSKLAIQYYDNQKVSVAIWDVATRKEICNFDLWPATIKYPRRAMLFSPDGTRLAVTPYRSEALQVWDTRTGQQLVEIKEDGRIFRYFFTQDGNQILYTFGVRQEKKSPSNFGYKVWDLKKNQVVVSRRYKSGEQYPNLAFLSRDGKRVGVFMRGSRRNPSKQTPLQIWDVETAKVLEEHTIDESRFRYCGVSPDLSRILFYDRSNSEQLALFDLQSFRQLATLNDEEGQFPTKFTFSPNGRFLAASTNNQAVLIWNLPDSVRPDQSEPIPDLTRLYELRVPRWTVELRFSADSKHLHSCIFNRIWTWDLPDDLGSGTAPSWSNGAIVGGSFNRDGTRAVMRTEPADFDQALALLAWDVGADRELWRHRAADDRAFMMPVLSPDAQYVVVPTRERRLTREDEQPGVFNTRLHVLDGNTGKEIRVFQPKGVSNISGMTFTPDGRHVAVFVTRRTKDKQLQWFQVPPSFQVALWNVERGEEVFAVGIDDEDPGFCGFTADGAELMVGLRRSGGLLVLDAATGETRRIIAPEGTELNQFGKWRLSPDGKTLAALGMQDDYREIAVAFYDAATGAFIRRIPVETTTSPGALCWSGDSRRIALVSNRLSNAKATIWDPETGRLLLTLNSTGSSAGHDRAIRFSPDNQRLLHITDDNRYGGGSWENPSLHPIHIWDATPIR